MPNAVFTWDGEALYPIPVHKQRCDDQLVVGERYHMESIEARSHKSHAHYFASLKDMWGSLPEEYGMEPWAQSTEHLRKYALIRTGYCLTQTFTCSSQKEAMRWASNIRGMDEYSITQAQGDVVHLFTAKTQSMKSMGKDDFQKSKDAVLNFVLTILERVNHEQFNRASGRI